VDTCLGVMPSTEPKSCLLARFIVCASPMLDRIAEQIKYSTQNAGRIRRSSFLPRSSAKNPAHDTWRVKAGGGE